MTWLRDRALPIVAVLCLLGQGTLIFWGSYEQRLPSVMLPGLFLLLSVGLAVVTALGIRNHQATGPRTRARFLGHSLLVLMVGSLLALSLGVLVQGGPFPDRITDRSGGYAEGSLGPDWEHLKTLQGALEDLAAGLAAELAAGTLAPPAGEGGDSPPVSVDPQVVSEGKAGDDFRLLGKWQERWATRHGFSRHWPVACILWRDGAPVAWTPQAVPLSPPPYLITTRDRIHIRTDAAGDWHVRVFRSLPGVGQLEVQVPVPTGGDLEGWAGPEIAVGRPDQAPLLREGRGTATSSVFLADSRGQRALYPRLPTTGDAVRQEGYQARLLLLLGSAWFLSVLGLGRLFWGWTGFLVGLWWARGVLAAVDFFRWVGDGFPAAVDPAFPTDIISLVGPAYFATPFAGGWFASTADALLTALVVAITSLFFLRRWGILPDGSGDRSSRLSGDGAAGSAHVLAALAFGLLGAAVLLGLRFFASLVTENANPRLIGAGVSLGFLSFWGLHITLMLISLSLTALLTGLAAYRRRSERQTLGAWLGSVSAVCLAAGFVFILGGLRSPTNLLLGVGGVGVFWVLAPTLTSRPRFLRRFAWPAVLLVAVIWNYAAMRQVYDQAERTWLEGKGQLIAAAEDDWTRFLVEDALLEMQAQDEADSQPLPAGGLWRHRPAYTLWRNSSLRDLGYSCLVEIMDAQGEQESLFATGFMRDYQYEVLERGFWTNRGGEPVGDDWEMIFQTERRSYAGGEEEILSAEVVRSGGRGWIRVELPTRSWRISTLLSDLTGGEGRAGGYQPRSEVDRPVLLLRGDRTGWLGTGDPGFTGENTWDLVKDLKVGNKSWARLQRENEHWLCCWIPLPEGVARTPDEGFLLGLRQAGTMDNILDLSRLMLLNLALLFLLFGGYQVTGRLVGMGGLAGGPEEPANPLRWLPGFQEKFLAGYLLLGMLLLLAVGASVDQVGYERVRSEARQQTRQGLVQAVSQLRNLMAEQATSLASSDYIADLLVGELEGQRPAGPLALRQGMVFAADGTLLLDETLSNLSGEEATSLLMAARRNDLLLIQEEDQLFVATSISIELGDDIFPAAGGVGGLPADPGHSPLPRRGYFLYRQRLENGLIDGLADLVRGQATLRIHGQPELASHPGPIFSGQVALLASPTMMASLLEHPGGPGVFEQPGRPFAFTGAQPLPVFSRNEDGILVRQELPAVLALGFPDREKEFGTQRRETVLFLAGLANLILLTALFLALLMSWNLFRPLRVLLTATRRLARGDFQAPLPVGGEDEVGRLATAFRTMRNELHSARERLAAREQFLTTVLDQVSVGVAVVSPQGRVVALNPAGRHLLTDFYPELREEEGAACLLEEADALAKGQIRWGGELRSADGQRTLRVALAPLRLPDQEADVLLVFEDITEFLQTKKMAINAELARQVAHEIKNPLTPIRLSIQLLDQAWRDGHPQLDRIVNDTVARVLNQVELLRTIASEFSLLGRPGELDLQPMDLPGFVAEVVQAYQGSIAAGEEPVVVELADQPVPEVLADADSLRKILGNLMENSMDAVRPGEPLVVAVGWEVSERMVGLVWEDNGQGLEAEVAEKLFDPYFSTKSKGTGLGLAICRNLVDRMGGTITLRNRPDGPGARAILNLPRSSGSPATADPAPDTTS
jgi:signal transduction histidine kinase